MTSMKTLAFFTRVWFQATCPAPSFRKGRQAVKDAKAACSIMQWKDGDMIDTLAAAYGRLAILLLRRATRRRR